MEALTLYELNGLVRQTLELTLDNTYWVQAEISELRVNRHCYMELVQKDKYGGGMVAKARAQVWANRWAFLKPMFEQTTGQTLSTGMQVLVQVEVTFHELYGFSLNITDIDPTYTLGDLARRRQEILRQLEEEGISTMNKELQLPRLLQRIAVISSATAAGYEDFRNQLIHNKRELAFKTKLYQATMQGYDVADSIISALNRIAKEIDEWDAVVIIRGGGATSDLQGFDSLELAEELDLLESFAARLTEQTQQLLYSENNRLKLLAGKVPLLYAQVKAHEDLRLHRLMTSLSNCCILYLEQAKGTIERHYQNLCLHAPLLVQNERNRILLNESKLQSAEPSRILRLGFSIARINGKAIRNANEIKEGDEIETILASGTFKSTITWTKK